MLTQAPPSLVPTCLHLGGGFIRVDPVRGKRGGHAHTLEKRRSSLDGAVDSLSVLLHLLVHHTVAVLQKLIAFLLTLVPKQPGQNNRQRLSMRQPVKRGQFVPDAMRSPVLRHTSTDQVV